LPFMLVAVATPAAEDAVCEDAARCMPNACSSVRTTVEAATSDEEGMRAALWTPPLRGPMRLLLLLLPMPPTLLLNMFELLPLGSGIDDAAPGWRPLKADTPPLPTPRDMESRKPDPGTAAGRPLGVGSNE